MRDKGPRLPVCTMTVRCTECEVVIGEYDTNTPSIISVVMRDRREHAVTAHGYPRRETTV
jgi:hypothetical protein